MEINFSFNINSGLYKKNPELSEIGKAIIKHSIELIYEVGIEHFTFKKLGLKSGHTEATIYRYFENKQKLLLYIVSWYWFYIDFLIEFKLQNIKDKEKKIIEIIDLLTHDLSQNNLTSVYNVSQLYHIVIREGNKVYLNKEVKEINQNDLYKPYKDLCAKISNIIQEFNPQYNYPNSLSSTLIEGSHLQYFFSENLPKLTDVSTKNKSDYSNIFLKDLIFKTLK